MKAYVIASGGVFALLVVAHIWRVVEEGFALAGDSWLILSTVVSAAFAFWAWRTLRRLPPS